MTPKIDWVVMTEVFLGADGAGSVGIREETARLLCRVCAKVTKFTSPVLSRMLQVLTDARINEEDLDQRLMATHCIGMMMMAFGKQVSSFFTDVFDALARMYNKSTEVFLLDCYSNMFKGFVTRNLTFNSSKMSIKCWNL